MKNKAVPEPTKDVRRAETQLHEAEKKAKRAKQVARAAKLRLRESRKVAKQTRKAAKEAKSEVVTARKTFEKLRSKAEKRRSSAAKKTPVTSTVAGNLRNGPSKKLSRRPAQVVTRGAATITKLKPESLASSRPDSEVQPIRAAKSGGETTPRGLSATPAQLDVGGSSADSALNT